MDKHYLYHIELEYLKDYLTSLIVYIPDSMISASSENEKLFNVLNRFFDNIFKILIDMTMFTDELIYAMYLLKESYVDEILMYTVEKQKVKELLDYIHLVISLIHIKALELELYEVATNCRNFENFNINNYEEIHL